MENEIDRYDVAELSEKEIQKLKSYEDMMKADGKDVILIAYQEENTPRNQSY